MGTHRSLRVAGPLERNRTARAGAGEPEVLENLQMLENLQVLENQLPALGLLWFRGMQSPQCVIPPAIPTWAAGGSGGSSPVG